MNGKSDECRNSGQNAGATVDRVSRDRLAEAMRHLLSGKLDNLSFDALDCPGGITDSDDGALFAVFYAAWFHYDDFHAHPLQLTDGERRDLFRCILFLHSSLPFEWARRPVGIVYRIRDWITGVSRTRARADAGGDPAVWPFFRRGDFQQALNTPRFLRGPAVAAGFAGGAANG